MTSRIRLGTNCSFLIFALLCLEPASAAGGDDVFRQWEKQQTPATESPRSQTTDTGSSERQTRAEAVDFGDFLPVYSNTVKYADIEKSFRASRVTEGIAEDLNKLFALPTNIRISYQECGQPNAFYLPKERVIVTCYELLEQLYVDFFELYKDEDKAKDAFAGAHMFIFFHELGHALISAWGLPITGKEEDAVDQLASYILVQIGQEGVLAALSAAIWFGSAKDSPSAAHYADEHSLSQQRYYNIVCWIYGSAPDFYRPYITEDILPKSRAQKCPTEYARMSQAWDKLLDPFLKR